MVHQSNPSLYNTNKHHNSRFSELSALTNPTFSSLWGVEENYLPTDSAQQHDGDQDFVVPHTRDVFFFPDNQLEGPQLPLLPDFSAYLSGAGSDRPVYSSEYPMNVAENGQKTDVFIQDYGSNSASAYHLTNLGSSWEIQSQGNHAASSENIRVGRYSVEERRDRILRYLKKRNRRNFNKTIKYACRKTLADRRTRVRGRFAKNNEEVVEMKHNSNSLEETVSPCPYYDYADDIHQMKQDGEDWLQEAITSLMYNIPHIPQWQGGLALQ